MEKWKLCLTLMLFTCCYGEEQPDSNSFSDILRDHEDCISNCTKLLESFKEECQRGCRFHSLEEAVADDAVDSDKIPQRCYQDCGESYGENNLRVDACNKGCDIQEGFAKKSKPPVEENGPSIHLLRPLMQIEAVYSSIVGAFHIVRSSLITYFLSDDNKIVAVESDPQIVLTVEAIEDDPIVQLQKQQQQARQLTFDDDNDEPSVVKCLSTEIGVPPYIIIASLLVILVFTLYVIMAICNTTTPSKVKTYANEKNIKIDPMALPIKLVRPEDLTRLSLTEEEEGEAPPLPAKVHLPQSLI